MRCRKYLLNSHRLHPFHELMAEDPIPITKQIAWSAVPWECLAELLSCPFCSRMGRDCEVDNAPTVMRQHQKYIEDLKPYCRHCKEVDRYEALEVVLEEDPPSLRGWFPSAYQYLLTLVSPISMPSLSNSP